MNGKRLPHHGDLLLVLRLIYPNIIAKSTR